MLWLSLLDTSPGGGERGRRGQARLKACSLADRLQGRLRQRLVPGGARMRMYPEHPLSPSKSPCGTKPASKCHDVLKRVHGLNAYIPGVVGVPRVISQPVIKPAGLEADPHQVICWGGLVFSIILTGHHPSAPHSRH